MVEKIQIFIKREAILVIAGLLAFVSCFFVLPDKEYLNYIDVRTMALLFCLMAVMAGLQETGLFLYMGRKLLSKVQNPGGLANILIFLCFFGSMFITNDVALITFVPFGILVLKMVNMEKLLCPVVTWMTIGANLGSMLTPIGNPQNLYLYQASGYSLGNFLLLMLPYTIISAVLLGLVTGITFRRKDTAVKSAEPIIIKMEEVEPDKKKSAFYLLLFLLCVLSVLGILRIEILLIIILAGVVCTDRRLLGKIDYSLLLTFLAFFIFIGNMGRFPLFYHWILEVLSGRETLTAVLLSQVISNVPAALLLSGFTQKWGSLIIGTNLGGLGTLIASMASLISYKQIAARYPDLKNRYLLIFTLWNLLFLAVLVTIYYVHLF